MLEPAASFVAGKPARVFCAVTPLDWGDYAKTNGTPEANALSDIPNGRSEFEPLICSTLRAKRPASSYDVAASLRILVHESVHLRGVTDEGQTECAAMHELPRVAVRFFHVKPGKQLRSLMAQAWRSHRAAAPAQQSVC